MSKFHLSGRSQHVEVEVPSHVDLTEEQLLKYKPFAEWIKTTEDSLQLQETDAKHRFHQEEKRYHLRRISIQSVDWWPTKTGRRIGFLKFDTKMSNDEHPEKFLPGTTFMRGGSVAVLIIIIDTADETQRWVVMTQQPRVPAGSLNFYEIPAGMIDDAKTFKGAAIQEVEEETGLQLHLSEMIDLTATALESAKSSESHLKPAMYPSPGGSDEYIALFAWEKYMDTMDINDLRDQCRGVDNEQIMVKLVQYDEVWREGARDAKTLAAWALYEGIQRFGLLREDQV